MNASSLLRSLLPGNHNGTRPPCRVAGQSHVGLVRTGNEDCYICINQPWRRAVVAGVADGMGGHEFGEIASYLVVRYLLDAWNARTAGDFASADEAVAYLRRALSQANNHIFHVNKVLRIRWAMGTTATLGVFWHDKLILAQVGDSRCYRWRDGQVRLLTADQNWQAEMVEHGVLSADEAGHHPLANMLTNCVGALRELHIEFSQATVAPGDRYLFCTDGISTLVAGEQIGRVLGEGPAPQAAAARLVEMALERGGNDNCTAVCAFLANARD